MGGCVFTMEFEFIALELESQEAEWLRSLLVDMPLWGRSYVPVSCIVICRQPLVLLKIVYTLVREDISTLETTLSNNC